MPPITTVGHNVARRLRVWRYPSRLCCPQSGPAPVLTLNPFLSSARRQHDSAHPQPSHPFNDPRLTAGLGEKIREISSRDLEPSSTPVSQDSGFKVVNSFNAIPGTASPVSVPGSAPSWKDPKLPVCLPKKRALEPPEARGRPLDPLTMLELSANMKPSVSRLDEVDIVVHASLLNILFSLCKGKSVGLRRVSLRMTQGTLFIADDPVTTELIHSNKVSRSDIIKQFAEIAPGLEDSTHYRSIQYSLGHVSCLVQHPVVVTCKTRPDELPQTPSPNTGESVVSGGSHGRSEPAFIAIRRPEKWASYRQTEDYWFSRTPLMLTLHVDREGNITRIGKVDTTARAARWERGDEAQVALRKLATLVSELKGAVKAAVPDGQECIGIIDRQTGTPRIRLFLPEGESKRAPADVDSTPSPGNTSHGPDEALEGGRQGPDSPA